MLQLMAPRSRMEIQLAAELSARMPMALHLRLRSHPPLFLFAQLFRQALHSRSRRLLHLFRLRQS